MAVEPETETLLGAPGEQGTMTMMTLCPHETGDLHKVGNTRSATTDLPDTLADWEPG